MTGSAFTIKRLHESTLFGFAALVEADEGSFGRSCTGIYPPGDSLPTSGQLA